MELFNVADIRTAVEIPRGTCLLAFRGSIAHGMYIPSSDPNSIDDVDLMGVVVGEERNYFGLKEWGSRGTKEIKQGRYDCVFYEIRKMVSLLLQGNPNVLGMLWTKKEHQLYSSPLGEELICNRHLFVGKHVYNAFAGYAHAQMEKMETRDPAELREYLAVTAELKYRGAHPNHKGEKFPWPATRSDLELSMEEWSTDKLVARLRSYQKKGDNIGYLGEKRKQLVLEHGYDCYDAATTEFLTEQGWKHYEDIPGSTRLLTVDPLTGMSEFQRPIGRKDGLHSGKMYLLEPHGTRAFVTPGHNLLVSPSRRSPKNRFSTKYHAQSADWKLRSVDDILAGRRSHFHVRTSPEPRLIDLGGVSDDFLRLAGAFVSEGSVQFRKKAGGVRTFKCIRITQKKPGPFMRMMAQLSVSTGLSKYSYVKETVWILYGPMAKRLYQEFGHGSAHKHLPAWCFVLSRRQAMVLWNAMMMGDGTEKTANRTIYTKSKQLAADIQAMMLSAGIPVVVYGPYKTPTEWNQELEMYHVSMSNLLMSFRDLNFGRLLQVGQKPKSVKDGYPVKEIAVRNRRVVCFEVPNGTLVTRNGGKPAIHGNSKNAAHLIRLLRMAKEFLETGELEVFRPDAAELLEIKKGKWTLAAVKEHATQLFVEVREARDRSTLPDVPDREGAEALLVRLVREHLATGWEESSASSH